MLSINNRKRFHENSEIIPGPDLIPIFLIDVYKTESCTSKISCNPQSIMIINCYKSIRDLVIVYWFLGSCSEQCVGVREWTEEWRKYRLTAKETKELNRRGTLGWRKNDEPGSFTLISIYHITCEWTINIVFMTFTITHHHPLNILWPFPFLSTYNFIKLFRKRKTHRHRTSRIVVSSSSWVAYSPWMELNLKIVIQLDEP